MEMDKNPAVGIILGLITAILAGYIWFLIIKYTRYEVGYMAIGVGFLVALVLLRYLGKGIKTTILAMLFTIVGLVVSKALVRYYIIPTDALKILQEKNLEEIKDLTVSDLRKNMLTEYPFHEYFIDNMNPFKFGESGVFTILFFFLALSTAYKTANYKNEETIDNEEKNTNI